MSLECDDDSIETLNTKRTNLDPVKLETEVMLIYNKKFLNVCL